MGDRDQGSIVKSLQKGLKLLKYMMYADREVSIQELEKEFGYNSSTIHHQLKTLIEEGFVSQNPESRKYGVGSELFYYNLFHHESNSYLERFDAILRQCCEVTGETVNLFVQKNDEVICIRGCESNQLLKANLQIGRRLPLSSTAAGRVFLTFGGEDSFEKYDMDTRIIEVYKSLGYTVEINEFDPSITAVSVPVYSKENVLKFSLCVIMPSSRVADDTLEALADILKNSSSMLTELII